VFHVVDPRYRDALRAKLALLGSRAQESAMTIAEQLHEEGLQQGLQQAREEGRQALVATVRSLLVDKFHALAVGDEARLRAASAEALDRYLRRVLSARSPAEVLAD